MNLQPVDVVESIDSAVFKEKYYRPMKPVVIKNVSSDWPAMKLWNWDYFKQIVGDKKVGLYNNVKSDAYTPINTADDYKTFGEYIDMIRRGPAAWRIFLFNIFETCATANQRFFVAGKPDAGFCKKVPDAVCRRQNLHNAYPFRY